jgi:predicted GNAT family N-acyltransferase
MEGPRPLNESEWSNLLSFLTHSLRAEHNWSIENEYPTALNLQNRHNIRIITDQNQIISHALVKPMVIKSPHIIFKVAGIGSVVTHENYRNQGFSQKVLTDCLAIAAEQKCDLAILWTHLHDFYRKVGFELAGTEISHTFDNEFPPARMNLRYSQDKNVSAEAINRLYSQHTVGSVRTADEIKQYLKIPHTKIYTAWNADNSLAAFAIEGKGADLQNYIHEWGGQVPDLLSLLSYIRKEKKQAFTIITPVHSHNLNKQLDEKAARFDGFLGMLKIVDEMAFFAKIKRAFRGEGISDFVLEKRGDGYLFGIGPDMLIVEREHDIIRLLFGPVDYSVLGFHHDVTIQKISKLLPLPFWVWGWDSV